MPTIDQLLASPDCDLSDPVGLCCAGEFRWGSCAAILYDPTRTDIFSQPFLYGLYEKTRLSGQRHPRPLDLVKRIGLGSLPALFCGMTHLGPDAITKYLAERAVCVVGEWRKPEGYAAGIKAVFDPPDSTNIKWVPVEEAIIPPDQFHPLGYCFPSTVPATSPLSLTGQPSNSVFAGYTIFQEAWRTPAQQVLMYLGLAWLFHTFHLCALHGSRYATNHLTRRWTHQFGFKDVGELPYCMAGPDGGAGELVSGVFSTLLRADFEERLRGVFVAVRRSASLSTAQMPAHSTPASDSSQS